MDSPETLKSKYVGKKIFFLQIEKIHDTLRRVIKQKIFF